MQPITLLVKALRDHSPRAALPLQPGNPADASGHSGAHPRESSFRPDTEVVVTPTAYTYLADVEDHCVTITASLDEMRSSASNMISLIFNTMGSYQNETFRQLTLVSVIFLPLTFLTGYMGMNFESFAAVQNHSDLFFWVLAVPFTSVMMLFLMRDMIKRRIKQSWQRRSSRRRHARTYRR